MKIIEIQALDNGAHRNQMVSRKPDLLSGWAVIPEDMTIPDTFPFVDITVKDNTVTSMTAKSVPTENNITKEKAIEKDRADLGIDFPITRIVSGEYTGTGDGTTVELSFDVAPKLLVVFGKTAWGHLFGIASPSGQYATWKYADNNVGSDSFDATFVGSKVTIGHSLFVDSKKTYSYTAICG